MNDSLERDNLVRYACTARTLTADDLEPYLNALEAGVLIRAAKALTKKYGVTNRAAGDLLRMAQDITTNQSEE
jgi:hypothetical protein